MAAKFKNKIVEVDTINSDVSILTAPVGKTIILKSFMIANENASNSSSAIGVIDYSVSTRYYIEFFTNTANNTSLNKIPIVLESQDVFIFRTTVADQHLVLSYVELDAGINQRYKCLAGATAESDTTGLYQQILTCPVGSKLIINFINLFTAGGDDTDYEIQIGGGGGFGLIASTKTLIDGTVSDNNDNVSLQQAYVLHSNLFDLGTQQSLIINTSAISHYYISYLEIRNPPTRA